MEGRKYMSDELFDNIPSTPMPRLEAARLRLQRAIDAMVEASDDASDATMIGLRHNIDMARHELYSAEQEAMR